MYLQVVHVFFGQESLQRFIEPFPVGLVITLISAVVLRKKAKAAAPPAVIVAASS